MNVNNLGFNGLYLSKANRVFVTDSYFGWSYHAASAISLIDIHEAVLHDVECDAAANTIYADALTQKLTVINSIYEHLNSLAHETVVIDTETPNEDPAQYVAEQFQEILEREPDPAAHVYWTNQLLLCSGGAQCINERRTALATYLGRNPSRTFSLSGRIRDAGGIQMPGVLVTLSGWQAVTALTNSNGDYVFSNLPTSGQYVVTPTKNHYTFNSPSRTFTTPAADQTGDFTAVLNTHIISGIITLDGSPLSGVTVTLSGGQTRTAITNQAGAYSFTVNAGGNYTLSAAKTHYTFAPPVRTTTDLGADTTLNFSATLNRHRISGHILTTSGELVPGVTMSLSGSQSEITTSGTDGTYSFTVNAAGNYTLTATKAHYTFDPSVRTATDLNGDITLNFNATLIRHRISGRILKINGEPLSGATVVLSGSENATATTASDGTYSFPNVGGGSNCFITAMKTNYSLVPQMLTFYNLGANQLVDFIATPLPVLLTAESSTRAVALESLTFESEPFSPMRSSFYGGDNRSRVMLFGTQLGLLPSEGAPQVFAEAEDAMHRRYGLVVEHVGPVPGLPSVTAIIVRLNDNLGEVGDVLVSVTVHNLTSNRVRIGIGHIGGGPPDSALALSP